MQDFDAVEIELCRLGGDELLTDARAKAHAYVALHFPWDGHGDEPPDRVAARLQTLSACRDRVHTDRDHPRDPEPCDRELGVRTHPSDPAPSEAAAVLAVRIAVSVQACPLIAGLHGGPQGCITTRTRAGELVGIRIEGNSVTVGVVGRAQADPGRIVGQVQAAVTSCAPASAVSVSISACHDPETGKTTAGGPVDDTAADENGGY